MAYLTYAEYKTFTADPVLEPEFDKLISGRSGDQYADPVFL